MEKNLRRKALEHVQPLPEDRDDHATSWFELLKQSFRNRPQQEWQSTARLLGKKPNESNCLCLPRI